MSRTFLTPGQRYAAPGSAPWRADGQITIVALDWDERGVCRVRYRCPSGPTLTLRAAELEAAIAGGQLVPVVGAGALACC